MSRWLNQVNNLLEKLDDQVERGDADALAQRMTRRFRGPQGGEESSEDEEDFFVEEEFEEDNEVAEKEEEEIDFVSTDGSDDGAPTTETDHVQESELAESEVTSERSSLHQQVSDATVENVQQPLVVEESPPTSALAPASLATSDNANSFELQEITLENQRLQKELARLQEQFKKEKQDFVTKSKKGLKRVTQENERLAKELQDVKEQLEHDRAEMLAQHDELEQAATRMEQDRLRSKKDKEQLNQERQAEVKQLKEHYESTLKDQKTHYEKEMEELRSLVKREEQKRLEEGGDWTKEVEEALDRERHALKELAELRADKTRLEASVSQLQSQQGTLRDKVDALTSAAEDASSRERAAEDNLDAFMAQHKRQLQRKQERENELEKTVADLSAALTVARQSGSSVGQVPVGEHTAENYKAKFTETIEEMEAYKTQITLLEQQRSALQHELREVSRERQEDVSRAREQQRRYDEKTSELKAQVTKLEAAARENQKHPGRSSSAAVPDADNRARLRDVTTQLDDTRKQLSSASSQLIRHQNMLESSKAEIITLKGKLQSATARAEKAEQSTPAATGVQLYEMEGGYVAASTQSRSHQRRVRRSRYTQLPSRSLLSAVGMQVAPGSSLEQVATTIDQLDTWILETGDIMRNQPMGRLGFAFYMVLVHAWCFGLVFFHTIESEHGCIHLRGVELN